MKPWSVRNGVLVAVVALFGVAGGHEFAPASGVAWRVAPKAKIVVGPSSPWTRCAVKGDKLPAEPKTVTADGHEVKVCGGDCAKKVEADAKTFAAKHRAAVTGMQQPNYPLENCPVTGQKLGSMGAPVDLVIGNRLVRLCCRGCVAKAQKDADAILTKIADACYDRQIKKYPLGTCVVGGGKLGSMGEPIEYLHGTRLLRFCCADCVAKFEADPETFLAKLDAAKK